MDAVNEVDIWNQNGLGIAKRLCSEKIHLCYLPQLFKPTQKAVIHKGPETVILTKKCFVNLTLDRYATYGLVFKFIVSNHT